MRGGCCCRTVGRDVPSRAAAMLKSVLEIVPAQRLACHFHDMSGMALANVDMALEDGIRIFDSAAGGVGGRPYAPGAAGNLPPGNS
ncbi:hypothetical protein OE766_13690 [Pararhizobium sp. YC-54]|uniref:hypothetical protein n=1 Tax=Pararhizobium sp. YC-54 TaxID=2986920 RepID=UPI0021F77FA6|nr:hypothetical protein [Pararhizobium sp. YC-54]MCV9999303.1 hypothetical protein [Pararhizobium sp. YC-54]